MYMEMSVIEFLWDTEWTTVLIGPLLVLCLGVDRGVRKADTVITMPKEWQLVLIHVLARVD